MNSTIVNVPVVTLINNGVEPRKELRFDMPFEADACKRITRMVMDSSVIARVNGMIIRSSSIPTVTVIMGTNIRTRNAEGDLGYEFKMINAESEGGDDEYTGLLAATGLAEVRGLSGSGVVTNRGTTKSADVNIPENSSDAFRQAAENMKSAMNQFLTALPIEAVGVGAEWKVELLMDHDGMSLRQTTNYKLIEVSADLAKCVTTMTMKTKAGELVANYNGEIIIDLHHGAFNTGWSEGTFRMKEGPIKVDINNKMVVSRVEI